MIKSKNKLKKLMINWMKKEEIMNRLKIKNSEKKKPCLILLNRKLKNIIKLWLKDQSKMKMALNRSIYF